MRLRSTRQSAKAESSGMLAAISSPRYKAGRATTMAGAPPKRLGAMLTTPLAISTLSGGVMRVPESTSLAGTLTSNSPSARSSVTASPSISTPCAMIVDSSGICTSATASTGRPGPRFIWRAKKSTFSALAKFTIGELISKAGMVCANTSAKKPSGSLIS